MTTRKPAGAKQEMIGRWRITTMSNWDNDFLDAESPAFIEFKKDGGGFHFGYVHCQIDWRPEARESMLGAAFTFDGSDEMDPTQGRGWAALQPDGTLRGHIYFHHGDDSSFVAKRRGQ